MASLIPDSVRETLADLTETYADIQAIKNQRRLAEAQASLRSLDMADLRSQVLPENSIQVGGGGVALSGPVLWIAIGLGGLLVWQALK